MCKSSTSIKQSHATSVDAEVASTLSGKSSPYIPRKSGRLPSKSVFMHIIITSVVAIIRMHSKALGKNRMGCARTNVRSCIIDTAHICNAASTVRVCIPKPIIIIIAMQSSEPWFRTVCASPPQAGSSNGSCDANGGRKSDFKIPQDCIDPCSRIG